MPSAGFEPAIPGIRRPHTYDLNSSAIGIGEVECVLEIITSDAEYTVPLSVTFNLKEITLIYLRLSSD